MEPPRRTRSLRSARLAPSTLSLTSPQFAGIDDVPEVLERSEFRLSDVRLSAQGVSSKGVLVKLFLISLKDTRSAGDSKRTVWAVGSPDATNWTPRKSKDAHKANAGATDKAPHAAKAWSAFKPRTKAKASGGKTGRQKEQRSSATGEWNVAEQPVQEGHSEFDDTSDEQEGEEDEEEDEEAEEEEAEEEEAEEEEAEEEEAEEEEEEDDAGEDDAGEDIEADPNDSEGKEDLEEEGETVVADEDEHDTEEQDNDGHDGTSEEAEAEEADKVEDEEVVVEKDLAEDVGEEGEKEAEGQQDAGRELGAGEEGERDGEEKSGDKAETHSILRGKDHATQNGQEEQHRDDGSFEKGQGDHHEVREDRENVEQQVTASHRNGARRSWDVGDVSGREEGERGPTSGEEERMVEDENESAEETRKRAFACSTPEERPNKRSKSDRGENEDDTATEDSPNRTVGLKTHPPPRTPSLRSNTPSPGSTIEVVRQASVVPGLEGTESAVWDAARRDPIFRSLSPEDQKKMVCTAVSLGSEKGIMELQRFVYNARRDIKQKGKSLESEFDISVSRSDGVMRNANGTFISSDSGLPHFSALYQQIETLEKVAIKLFVTRRVKLAAMAQYRKALVQNVAGRNQAKDAKLHLFRAIHPEHATIERPDKAKKSVVLSDWKRLGDRLGEGRRWLDIRDLFGGAGAFLALPPQCVSDRYVQKMPMERFGSWLRLLGVAWRALDDHARLTLNELARMSLAGQPLPEGFLALEMLEEGTDIALTSLSGMFTGWAPSDRTSRDNGTKSIAIATQREEDNNDAAASMYPATTLITPRRAEEADDMGLISQKEMVESVEDGLFDGFDDLGFD
jgi:hypothetical protein